MQRAVTMHTRLVPIQPRARVFINFEGVSNGLPVATGVSVRAVHRRVDVQPGKEQICSVGELQEVPTT